MSKRKRPQFTLRAEWKEGPPNAAWDELWRRIFAGPLRGFSVSDTSREQ
ncbi:MAG: hypothetical protein ACM3S1_05765 [Hyphomicrobiales bacterium]|jgi:hypothetical protein